MTDSTIDLTKPIPVNRDPAPAFDRMDHRPMGMIQGADKERMRNVADALLGSVVSFTQPYDPASESYAEAWRLMAEECDDRELEYFSRVCLIMHPTDEMCAAGSGWEIAAISNLANFMAQEIIERKKKAAA